MTTLKDSARHIDNPVCPVLSKICGVGFSLVFIGPSIAMLVVGVKLRGNCPADKNIPVFMIGITITLCQSTGGKRKFSVADKKGARFEVSMASISQRFFRAWSNNNCVLAGHVNVRMPSDGLWGQPPIEWFNIL